MRGRPGQRSRPRKKRGTYQPGVGETPGTPQRTGSHTTGRGNRGSERAPAGTPSRSPGRTRTRGRTHKTAGQHAHPRADRTKARDLPVPTYIPSPCPTPPRITPQAPPLLGFPCSGGLRGPSIRGRLAAPCPLPRRVSCFPLTQAGFVAWPPGIRGGLNGIRGGLAAVRGSAHVCRSNPPGNHARPRSLGWHRPCRSAPGHLWSCSTTRSWSRSRRPAAAEAAQRASRRDRIAAPASWISSAAGG